MRKKAILLLFALVVAFLIFSNIQFKVVSAEPPGNVTFGRTLDCEAKGCAPHRAPPGTDVNMTISFSSQNNVSNVNFTDIYENNWTMVNANGGIVEQINETHSKISFFINYSTANESRWYIIKSPAQTTPPTRHWFQSKLNGNEGEPWFVIVTDPPSVVNDQLLEPCQTTQSSAENNCEPNDEGELPAPQYFGNITGPGRRMYFNLTINETTAKSNAYTHNLWVEYANSTGNNTDETTVAGRANMSRQTGGCPATGNYEFVLIDEVVLDCSASGVSCIDGNNGTLTVSSTDLSSTDTAATLQWIVQACNMSGGRGYDFAPKYLEAAGGDVVTTNINDYYDTWIIPKINWTISGSTDKSANVTVEQGDTASTSDGAVVIRAQTINQSNTNVTEQTGNGTAITSANGSWPQGSNVWIKEANTYQVKFTCSPSPTQALGIYETIYKVDSDADVFGDNMTMKCIVTQHIVARGINATKQNEPDDTQGRIFNGSQVNISGIFTVSSGTINSVVAEIFYPNGTFWRNSTMSAGANGLYSVAFPLYYNFSTYEIGNFSATIYTSGSDGGEIKNGSVVQFAPFINSTFLQHEIGIDGTFTDWHNVTGFADAQSDTLFYAARKANQFFRPNSTGTENGPVNGIPNAFDWNYNNTNTSATVYRGSDLGPAIENYTVQIYKNPMGEVNLYTTIQRAGTSGSPKVEIFNYSSGTWFTWLPTSDLPSSITTFSKRINRSDGFINQGGNFTVRYTGTAIIGNGIDVYDIYASAPGRNYTFEGITSPSSTSNATAVNSTSLSAAKWCTVDAGGNMVELSTANYRRIELDDGAFYSVASSAVAGSRGGICYHFKINENASRINRVYAYLKFNASQQVFWQVFNVSTSLWESIATIATSTTETTNLAIFDVPSSVIDNGAGIDTGRYIHFKLIGPVATAYTLSMDYATVQLNLSEMPTYDIRNVSIANNLSTWFFRIDTASPTPLGDATQYIRVYIDNFTSTDAGEGTSPSNNENLPFSQDYRIEVRSNGAGNTLNCTVNDNTVVVGMDFDYNCSVAQTNERLEIGFNFSHISIGNLNNTTYNVSFETGDSVDRFDLAPDYASFINYTIASGAQLAAAVCTLNLNETSIRWGKGGLLSINPNTESDRRDINVSNTGSTAGDVDIQGTQFDGPDGPSSLGVNNTSYVGGDQPCLAGDINPLLTGCPLTLNLKRHHNDLAPGDPASISSGLFGFVPASQKAGEYNQNITYIITC